MRGATCANGITCAGRFSGHLDHVVAKRRLDDVAHLPGLQGERRGLECGHHLALREETEIAPALLARVVRVGAGEPGEIGARARLLQHVLGFRTRRSLHGGGRALGTMMSTWLARTASGCWNLSGFFS